MKLLDGITVVKKKIDYAGRKTSVLILSPKDKKEVSAGVLWLHGGGYATGMKEMVFFSRAISLVKKFNVTIIAPGYTLSIKKPYPAALEDCYGALLYMRKHCDELLINPKQIFVGGESAGGGLTAALCMYARDRKVVDIAFQMPLYPMLDNFDTESSYHNKDFVWNTKRNHKAWKLYLRDDYKQSVSCYASPSRCTNYEGLPPCYSFVCTNEPFLDETKAYINRLKDANVEAKLHIYKGMFHAFDMLCPKHKTSKKAIENFEQAFAYALENYQTK